MKKQLLMTMATVLLSTSASAQGIQYPKADKDGTVDNYFGTEVADPYRWLEDDTSAKTAAWVEAENKITNSYLSKIPFRQKLLKRLTEVANYEKLSAPRKHHGRWYFYKNDGLQNQYVMYVMDQLGGTPRVFLDPNKLSTDGTVALQGVYFSNNGKYAAYTISPKFSGAAWQGDGFYYSAYDAPTQGKEFSNVNEGMKIYYHKIGTPQSDDVLFYQNPAQPKRFYTVSVNEEETMMFLYEDGAGAGNTLFVRDLRKPNSQFIQMTADMDYRYTPLYTEGEKIYLFTNYGAPRNRIMTADINRPGINDWQELIAEQQNVLNNADVINRQLILTYSQDASDHAYLYGLDGRQIREVKLPSVGSVGFTGDEHEPECFYTFTSFTVPGTIYRYDLATGESTLYAKPNVKFQQEDYTSEQVFFQSKDGTRIPMFLTYKKNVKSPRPVYLYGYGGFNIAIYAQVTLRGGSEYGEEWHLAGTKMQKQNVFDDFIAAAEWLIREGYTTNEKIAIVGGSNGGLLVGACMTQRPDLFRVAIPQVGVMDMLRYHKFTIGWNWASDYGTSEDSREMFEYLRGYSPLHNLKPGTSYPATLVTTADHDDRVVPAHSFKFAATLQECHKGTNPVLIRIDTKAGHGGGKPLAKILEEQADIYSFILYNMGIKFK